MLKYIFSKVVNNYELFVQAKYFNIWGKAFYRKPTPSWFDIDTYILSEQDMNNTFGKILHNCCLFGIITAAVIYIIALPRLNW